MWFCIKPQIQSSVNLRKTATGSFRFCSFFQDSSHGTIRSTVRGTFVVEKQNDLVQLLAETLGETESDPFTELAGVVEHFGEAFARALLIEVQEIEANGGILTKKGDRRRTPGGVFLFLARKRAKTSAQKKVFEKSG